MDNITPELIAKWKRKTATVIAASNKGLINLNDWELSFIDSIDIQLSTKNYLSFKQSQRLNELYDKV